MRSKYWRTHNVNSAIGHFPFLCAQRSPNMLNAILNDCVLQFFNSGLCALVRCGFHVSRPDSDHFKSDYTTWLHSLRTHQTQFPVLQKQTWNRLHQKKNCNESFDASAESLWCHASCANIITCELSKTFASTAAIWLFDFFECQMNRSAMLDRVEAAMKWSRKNGNRSRDMWK